MLFYNIGALLGILGMLAAVLLLAWTTFQLTLPFAQAFLTNTPPPRVTLQRRDIVPTQATHTLPIQPIIPGLTVPLSHLFLLIPAVFLSQIIHELGHAIAAALDRIPITSSGLSLTLVIPSAFVALPSSSLAALPTKGRARIVAAGPYHNLLCWLLVILVGYAGLGQVVRAVAGYEDVSVMGRVVVGVDMESPLYDHLPPKTLITHLDDFKLGTIKDGSTILEDPWTSYLTDSNLRPHEGWCIPSNSSKGAHSCCPALGEGEPTPSPTPDLSCFVSTTDPLAQTCLDPVPLLTSAEYTPRCGVGSACETGYECVEAADGEKLLRVTARRRRDGGEYVILWRGPREEVLDQVEVGRYSPRFWFLPIRLPVIFESFWEYLKMASLSLFVFNLLPVRGLDGAQFLDLLFAGDHSRREGMDSYDVESLDRPIRTRQRWRGRVTSVVVGITTWGVGFCTVVGFARLLVGR